MDIKHSDTPQFEDQPNAIDIQSNCIELTLLAGQRAGKVPFCYTNQLDTLVKEDVMLWWNLMQETACALNNINRTVWARTEEGGRVVDSWTITQQLGALKLMIRGGARIEWHRKLSVQEKEAIKRLDLTLMYYQVQHR